MGKQQGAGSNDQNQLSLDDLSFIQAVFFVIASLFFVAGSGLAFYVAWQNLKGGQPPNDIFE